MTTRQPSDEWEFLPDDVTDADEPTVTSAAEAAALHIEGATAAGAMVEAPADAPPIFYFEDEQPEDAEPRRYDDGAEPDLVDLLESQHYLFEEGSA